MMLITAIFALRGLGQRSLWVDEGFSAAAAGSNGRLIGTYRSGPQFALYYTLLRGWSTLGSSEFALRLLSVVFAVLTIPALYWLARRLYGTKAAMVAVVVLCANGFFLGYAQEARPYALVTLTSTVATLCLVRALDDPDRPGRWTAWALAATVATLSHPFGVLTVAAHVIVLLIRHRSVPLRDIAYTLALPAGLFGSLGLLLLQAGPARLSWIPVPGGETFVRAAFELSGSRGAGTFIVYLVGVGALAVAVARARPERRRQLRKATVVVAAAVVTPIAGALLASAVQPLFVARYLIVILPPLAIIVGAGVAQLRPAVAIVVMAALLTVALPTVISPIRAQPIEDWRGAAALVEAGGRADDVVILPLYGAQVLSYYLKRDARGASTPSTVYEGVFLLSDTAPPQPCHLRGVWLMIAGPGLYVSAERLEATHEVTQSSPLQGITVLRLDRRATAGPALPAEQPCA
jgi:mannosyltransferase